MAKTEKDIAKMEKDFKKKESWTDMSKPPTYIRYRGVWDMQDLYEFIVDWSRRRKYKFQERQYKHKHPSPFGVERQYIWEATRKESEFIEFHYDIYIHTYDAHDIDVVMADGSKKIFTKGRVWIVIKPKVISDWAKRWAETSFYSRLKAFYNKYIIKKDFTQGWGPKMRYEKAELINLIKTRLKMESDEFEWKYRAGGYKKI